MKKSKITPKLNNMELFHSRFCYYIQLDENKRRATMHINRSPVNRLRLTGLVIQPNLLTRKLTKLLKHGSISFRRKVPVYCSVDNIIIEDIISQGCESLSEFYIRIMRIEEFTKLIKVLF